MNSDKEKLLKQYIKESLQEAFWDSDEDDYRSFRRKKKPWYKRLLQSIPNVLGIERSKSSKKPRFKSPSMARLKARKVFDEWFKDVEDDIDSDDLDDLRDMKRDIFSAASAVYISNLKKQKSESEAAKAMIKFLEENYEEIF